MAVLSIIGQVLTVLGALAFFIFGMKMMSDGVQRAAGTQLRNILRNMTKNRYLGVLTGFFITALVQSSSATTVMTVSFVNAGLLTLVESAGVMMGANIGTTVTAWIISILGLKVSLSAYSIPLFAFGLPMTFSEKGNWKHWGEFIIGFAILFLGLSALKDAVPALDETSAFLGKIQEFSDYGFISRVAFVFLGALVTLIVQSSSAAMAVTLTMCYNGWLPLDVGAAMVLGENIGTTITAELASLVGNTNAKRSARIHSMFNIIGVVWMIILMPYILEFLKGFVENSMHIFEGAIEVEKENATREDQITTFTLAAFHTFFNLTNVLLLIPFVGYLVRLAIWSVPSKAADQDEEQSLKFIGAQTRTPELAIDELQKETESFGGTVASMSKHCKSLINTVDAKERKKLIKKINKLEKRTDQLEIDITEYITKLSNQEISNSTSARMRGILNVCNDLERIGDVYNQIAFTIEQKNEEKIYFLPEQRNNLNTMIAKIDEAFAAMMINLSIPPEKVDLSTANTIENEIDELRNIFREENLKNLGSKEYNVRSAMIYNNIFTSLEQIGDHILTVSKSLVGEI